MRVVYIIMTDICIKLRYLQLENTGMNNSEDTLTQYSRITAFPKPIMELCKWLVRWHVSQLSYIL